MSTTAPTTAAPTTAARMTPSPSFRGPYRDIPIPGNPDPSHRQNGNQPSPQAPPSRRAHAHTAPALTRTHAHASTCGCLHTLTCRVLVGSVLYPPSHIVPVVPRSTSDRTACARCRFDHSVPHALGYGGIRLGFGLAGDVESIAVGSLLWSCADNCTDETCIFGSGAAAAATPAGLNCQIGTGTGLAPPQLQWDWARPSPICTGTGADRHATRRTMCLLMSRRRLLCRPLQIHYGRRMRRAEVVLRWGLS
jgi:hypothetical protein